MAGSPKKRRRAMAARMDGPGRQGDAREALQNARAEAVAEGVALFRAGHTIRFAADKCGIPQSTLHKYYMKLLGPEAPDREDRRRDSEARIEASSTAVAEGMLASMARDIEVDAAHPFLEPKDKAMYSQAATRSLERIRGRHSPLDGNTSTGWADWLSKLQDQGGGSVKIEVETGKPVYDLEPSHGPEKG